MFKEVEAGDAATVSDAQPVKELEQENGKAKRLLPDSVLRNDALKDLLSRNFRAHSRGGRRFRY